MSTVVSIMAARGAGGPCEWKVEGTGVAYRDWLARWLGEGVISATPSLFSGMAPMTFVAVRCH